MDPYEAAEIYGRVRQLEAELEALKQQVNDNSRKNDTLRRTQGVILSTIDRILTLVEKNTERWRNLLNRMNYYVN